MLSKLQTDNRMEFQEITRPALWQRVTGWREWWWCDCGLDVVMLKPPNNSQL